MTDVHCHVSAGDPSIRELLIGREFVGIHPWETLAAEFALERRLAEVAAAARAPACCGIGEIGLDRLKVRDVSEAMRAAFVRQLALAGELGCPVVLHGAKCWGQVVKGLAEMLRSRQAASWRFLCHGFSRSDGLIPEIVRLGGYFSVGPAVLNDHAVNYRAMIRRIPRDRLLVETDRDSSAAEGSPSIRAVAAGLARVLELTERDVENLTDRNAERFLGW